MEAATRKRLADVALAVWEAARKEATADEVEASALELLSIAKALPPAPAAPPARTEPQP